MGADFYIANGYDEVKEKNLPVLLTLESNPYYWFLYRYFESANLDRRHELIDLYGDAALGGYQLDRLEDELNTALIDVSSRPETWNVLVGWKSEQVGRATEDWRPVEKPKLVDMIRCLLGLIDRARDSDSKLLYVGD